ncbi:MAG TPA: hypothetical protein VMP08_22165 [Anaerolineae bacterium]|nr:hypothetical protein [Anaerolineae bacterium]
MKSLFSSTVVWKTAAVVIAMAMAVSLAGTTLAAAPASQINVKDQDITSGVITIDSVTAPQAGWVVIYKDPNFSSGDIVGYAPVQQGVNTNVKVTLDARRVDATAMRAYALPTLWVRLHVDNPVMGLFEWGLHNLPYNDAPVVENGHTVIAEFGTTTSQEVTNTTPAAPATTPAQPAATPAPSTKTAGGASAIDVTTQALNSGVMHVDSVTAPQDGWLVVYKSPNFTAGEIVGYAPVHMGVNTNVPVTIDTKRVKDLSGLWVVLQADNGTPGVFEWGLRNLPYDDQPVSVNGHMVMTGFGITDVPQ